MAWAYRVWALEDFVNTDLSIGALALTHKHRQMHVVKALELPESGISFPLRGEYDRLNHTLEGLREVQHKRAQECDILAPPPDDYNPDIEEVTSQDRWVQLAPHQWMRIHTRERRQLYVPVASAAGPDLDQLGTTRITHALFTDGTRHCFEDDWQGSSANVVLKQSWTGTTIFTHNKLAGMGADVPEDPVPAPGPIDPAAVDRSRPWDGPEVPQPVDGADDSSLYKRNPKGVWCKPDHRGALRPVDRFGNFWRPAVERKGERLVLLSSHHICGGGSSPASSDWTIGPTRRRMQGEACPLAPQ